MISGGFPWLNELTDVLNMVQLESVPNQYQWLKNYLPWIWTSMGNNYRQEYFQENATSIPHEVESAKMYYSWWWQIMCGAEKDFN